MVVGARLPDGTRFRELMECPQVGSGIGSRTSAGAYVMASIGVHGCDSGDQALAEETGVRALPTETLRRDLWALDGLGSGA